MDISKIAITDLIPQRSPFIMVDRIISCDETDAVTEFTIREDNIFVDNGTFSEAGIIENLAQSTAARMGCVKVMRGEPIKVGYIGDIKNCEIGYRPQTGDLVTARIHILENILNLTLAEVSSMVGDKLVATVRMKFAQME